MKTTRTRKLMFAAVLACAVVFTTTVVQAADPVPSLNDGPGKKAIVDFVKRVTTPGSKDFVSAPERIATFDNDGTLWAQQPMYFPLSTRKTSGKADTRTTVQDGSSPFRSGNFAKIRLKSS